MQRREFIKAIGVGGCLVAGVGPALSTPRAPLPRQRQAGDR